ncbi:MAG: histidinol dehydrogenase [Candidatus Hadarchaeales archaeon]
MMRVVELSKCSPKERKELLKRSEIRIESVLRDVAKIVDDVRRRGDRALLEYTKKFDKVTIFQKRLRVSEDEIEQAVRACDEETIKALENLARAIRKFHLKQLPREWFAEISKGVTLGQVLRPLDRVGVYVPGGQARYPSTLLMGTVPAKVAGVKEVIVCTPPMRDGSVNSVILAAAKIAKVDAVFRVGGAQAIAAMAYGTESIPKVDKIVGPGNIYVSAAKRLVSSVVDVDFEAGPTELLIVADESASPVFLAADIIAQAEHDVEAACVLVTTSRDLARETQKWIMKLLVEIPRKNIVIESLNRRGLIVLVKNLQEAIDFANDYAPEHLELVVKNSKKYLKKVRNAGAIFLGSFSPVAVGDLASGPNHILPTGGKARFRSGLSVLDFLKILSVQELTRKGLKRLAPIVNAIAKVEDLEAHSLSVKVRLQRED